MGSRDPPPVNTRVDIFTNQVEDSNDECPGPKAQTEACFVQSGDSEAHVGLLFSL